MSNTSQSFENHARWDPLYHFFLIPVAAITLIWVGYNAYHLRTAWAHWEIIVAIAAIVAIFKIRLYALKAQDRVIRLEERLRLATLVPSELRPRINELTGRQLVALRFCCDAELPALATRALQEKMEPKEIKKQIKTWRADEFRI
jgi:hypothetical protein